jgi:hypothetical protein
MRPLAPSAQLLGIESSVFECVTRPALGVGNCVDIAVNEEDVWASDWLSSRRQ